MKQQRLSFKYALPLLFLSLFCVSPVLALTLDDSFSEEGWVTTRVGHHDDEGRAVAVQDDGRIVVAGSSSNMADDDFALVRYTGEGKLDTTFNMDGRVITDVGGADDHANDLVITDNGKIVAAGYTLNGTNRDFALVRYKSDGSLDESFGEGGVVALSLQHGDEEISAIVALEDGSVMAAGYVSGTAGRVTALLRFLPDGSLDKSFADAGIAMVALGSDAVSNDLVVLEDGRVVATGSHRVEDETRLQLIRFLADGKLDKSFGSDGIAASVVEGEDSAGNGLWVHGDGSILVAGSVGMEGEKDIALFRYLATGEADMEFGEGGLLRRDIHGEEDDGRAVLTSTEVILLTGYATLNGQRDFVLLQYRPTLAGEESEEGGALHIRDLVVEDLYLENDFSDFSSGDLSLEEELLVTEIGRQDDASYGFALVEGNKLVAVGDSEESGLHSFALAGYVLDFEASSDRGPGTESSYIITTEVTEVTRVGAYTGGTIRDGLGLSKRGVVYSVAPYPTLRSDSDTESVSSGSEGYQTTDDSVTDDGSGDSDDSGSVSNGDVSWNPFAVETVTSGYTEDGSGPGQYNSILSGLTPGTTYYVRAYGATSTGDVYY
ncbi:MAG: delta-60 repeat domain-containing protein, partial [Thermodesulfobacteriota bacterium]